ncbi:hypothetical protein FISHEDRAFT_56895 [Fistulina hepatica ATCC 64428]|uniref:Uncharacterized protein n=1 Tax=Fistulina hepatica ATCC 64428 TaxID=1128425 RepID=A0A0D7AKU4_9AGAR|nr:hypothetical protein FISHEDRAFT_56895 [Fistulina hepatica ATCC 64428]
MCGTRVRYCEVRKCSNSKCRSEVPSGEVVTSAYFDSSESSLFYLWWLSRLMPRTNIFGPPPKPKKPPRPAADEDSDPEGAAELAQLKAETRRIEHRRTCKKYYFEHHDEVLDRAAERRARKKEEIKSIYFEEELPASNKRFKPSGSVPPRRRKLQSIVVTGTMSSRRVTRVPLTKTPFEIARAKKAQDAILSSKFTIYCTVRIPRGQYAGSLGRFACFQ